MSRKERGGCSFPVASAVVLRSLTQGENRLLEKFQGLVLEGVLSRGESRYALGFLEVFHNREELCESFLIRPGLGW